MASSKWEGYVESRVMAPLKVVWNITSDFYEANKWFPGLNSCERVEGAPDNGLGSVRRCIIRLPADEESRDYFIIEELIAQDDINHSFTFRMTNTDLPAFIGQEVTFEFCETGEDGNCLMKWSYQMKGIEGGSKEEMDALRRSILIRMVNNLEELASSL